MTVNICTNPDFETNTAGWSSSGTSTFARTTSEFHGGAASLHVVFDGVTAFPNANFGASAGFNASGIVTATAAIWIKGTGTTNLYARWYVNGFAAVRSSSAVPISLTGTWTRYSATASSQAGDTNDAFQLFLGDQSGGTSAADFYADDAEMFVVIANSRIPRQFQLRPY